MQSSIFTMQTLLKGTGAYALLQRDGESGSFSHAYLLLWEDEKNLREGLKTFAKLFFGCAEPKTAAEIRRAELIEAESFADCVFFPEKGKKLVVEDAEKIVEESALAPVEGDTKLFVLTDFAEANAQTQNKLLKLLEEPPEGVRFLLGATSAFPVLQTVLSRTKKLEILPFTETEVASFLSRNYQGYDGEALLSCAAASGGSVGEARSILEGGYYANLLDSAFALLLSPIHALPNEVKKVADTPYKKGLLSILRLICRDALLIKIGKSRSALLKTETKRLKEVADGYKKATLLYAQDGLTEAEKQVKFNGIFSQCLETCIANILAKNKENL